MSESKSRNKSSLMSRAGVRLRGGMVNGRQGVDSSTLMSRAGVRLRGGMVNGRQGVDSSIHVIYANQLGVHTGGK
jgi:hypothetical protein